MNKVNTDAGAYRFDQQLQQSAERDRIAKHKEYTNKAIKLVEKLERNHPDASELSKAAAYLREYRRRQMPEFGKEVSHE